MTARGVWGVGRGSQVRRSWFAAVAVVAAFVTGAHAQQQPGMPGSMATPGTLASAMPAELADVTFQQRLNGHLPLDARFVDDHGKTVALGDYFGTKPVMLAFVYYQCPMLCTQIFNGVSSALKVIPFVPGKDFDVVYVSFDPRDTPEGAAAKKAAVLADYKQDGTANGWHFLTGDPTNAEANIRRVTSAAGFSYRWDERSKQFAHVSGVLIATPDGRLSRYFYGVEYSPKELRMALVESGNGKIGSPVDQLLLYCYHYDPSKGRYGVIAMNLIRAGGAFTVVLLGGFIWLMRKKEKTAIANPAIPNQSPITNH